MIQLFIIIILKVARPRTDRFLVLIRNENKLSVPINEPWRKAYWRWAVETCKFAREKKVQEHIVKVLFNRHLAAVQWWISHVGEEKQIWITIWNRSNCAKWESRERMPNANQKFILVQLNWFDLKNMFNPTYSIYAMHSLVSAANINEFNDATAFVYVCCASCQIHTYLTSNRCKLTTRETKCTVHIILSKQIIHSLCIVCNL